MTTHIISCPHCKDPIIIMKINCGIFRHGVMIKTGKQIDPHADKQKCEQLIKDNLIYGCGKPFKITKLKDNELNIEICDYI